MTSQRCGGDGLWEAPGTCFSEGACLAGEVERDTTLCGDRSRLCDATCAWTDWLVTTPPGECEAGAVGTPSITCSLADTPSRVCSSTCVWSERCVSGCPTPPTSSRSGAIPVCISAGDFVLGAATADEAPQTTVRLSAFHIDRNLVSAERFRACVAGGGCAAPVADSAFHALIGAAVATTLTWTDADAFCRWDGGRLPTEYQWEKAARGPAPDTRSFPYDGARDCRVTIFCGADGRAVYGLGWDALDWRSKVTIEFRVDALLASTSPWGVSSLGAGVHEYTATGYLRGYAAVSPVDPGDQPGSGPGHVMRGGTDGPYMALFPSGWRTATQLPGFGTAVRRVNETSEVVTYLQGFRCVY